MTEEMQNYRDECVQYAKNVLSGLDLNYLVSGEELYCTEGDPLSMMLELALKSSMMCLPLILQDLGQKVFLMLQVR